MGEAPPRWLLDHHALESTTIDEDVAFYEKAGMRLVRWGINAVTGKRIVLMHDGHAAKLELIEVDACTGQQSHTAYLVPDVAAEYQRLLGLGATAVTAPFRLEPARADSAMLRLPGGAAVQLVRYDDDSADLLPLQRLLLKR